jgi:hypothetical protein
MDSTNLESVVNEFCKNTLNGSVDSQVNTTLAMLKNVFEHIYDDKKCVDNVNINVSNDTFNFTILIKKSPKMKVNYNCRRSMTFHTVSNKIMSNADDTSIFTKSIDFNKASIASEGISSNKASIASEGISSNKASKASEGLSSPVKSKKGACKKPEKKNEKKNKPKSVKSLKKSDANDNPDKNSVLSFDASELKTDTNFDDDDTVDC